MPLHMTDMGLSVDIVDGRAHLRVVLLYVVCNLQKTLQKKRGRAAYGANSDSSREGERSKLFAAVHEKQEPNNRIMEEPCLQNGGRFIHSIMPHFIAQNGRGLVSRRFAGLP